MTASFLSQQDSFACELSHPLFLGSCLTEICSCEVQCPYHQCFQIASLWSCSLQIKISRVMLQMSAQGHSRWLSAVQGRRRWSCQVPFLVEKLPTPGGYARLPQYPHKSRSLLKAVLKQAWYFLTVSSCTTVLRHCSYACHTGFFPT